MSTNVQQNTQIPYVLPPKTRLKGNRSPSEHAHDVRLQLICIPIRFNISRDPELLACLLGYYPVDMAVYPMQPARHFLLFFVSAVVRHLDKNECPEQANQWAVIEFRVEFGLGTNTELERICTQT